MSIRTKLLFSYIAMIVIPVLLLGATILLAANLFTKEIGRADVSGSVPFAAIRELFAGRTELASGLRFIAGQDPKLLSDPTFLAQTEAELAEVDSGMVIAKSAGEAVLYASPGLDADLIVQHAKYEDGQRFAGDYQNLDLIPYTDSSGQASLLIIVSDMEPVANFFKRFIPTVLLALLAALILTNGTLTYLVSRSIIRPLHALRDAAGQIREGQLDRAIVLRRQDEIGQLGTALEEMRVRLRSSLSAQLQLEQSRKELLASISHDLKTPITAIQGCVDCLQGGIADTEEKRSKYVAMIGGKAADMTRMIEELLLFATLDTGKVPFRFEKLDAAAYMSQTVDELKLDPRFSGVDIRYVHRAGERVLIHADREKLHRAISNIADNSLRHMDKASRALTVELEHEPGSTSAAIAISDNGAGISPEALPFIFDQFYREEASRRPDRGSSGLGLAIVKQIIEEHGGTLEARSRKGEGTTIVMRLPAIPHADPSSEGSNERQ
ncbi:sensor histidine kinase [Paenibacillus montanisoli]|uniref:histidine kinase n=1 Tax=Paenibacillus montanisoli TaxID=2081970 RepID=A0A328U3X8_9BACL|nr:HAMP domain-containing sensor histidine kinase [Paenibacillus montanisoli]RAP74694.1 sensor histidine kinase [Paenibacillus montanisoli]